LLQITVSYKKKLSAVTEVARALPSEPNKPTSLIEKLAFAPDVPPLGFSETYANVPAVVEPASSVHDQPAVEAFNDV